MVQGRASRSWAVGNHPQGFSPLPARFLMLGLILQTAASLPRGEPKPHPSRGSAHKWGRCTGGCRPALGGISGDGDASPGTSWGALGCRGTWLRPGGPCCSPEQPWVLFLWKSSEKRVRLLASSPVLRRRPHGRVRLAWCEAGSREVWGPLVYPWGCSSSNSRRSVSAGCGRAPSCGPAGTQAWGGGCFGVPSCKLGLWGAGLAGVSGTGGQGGRGCLSPKD